MLEPQKRMVLCRFWVGDILYHRMTGDRGLVTGIQFNADKLSPRYYLVFENEVDGWCDEMEMTNEKVCAGVDA